MIFSGPNWIKRLASVAYFGLLLCCINACGQNSASAKVFLASLYKGYQMPKAPDYLGHAADTIFTSKLLKLIRLDQEQSKGEVGLLDYDPICDCQDFDISNVQINTMETANAKLEASVLFTNSGKDVKIDFTLEIDEKRWKIADIHSKSKPSLDAFLKTNVNGKMRSAKPSLGKRADSTSLSKEKLGSWQ